MKHFLPPELELLSRTMQPDLALIRRLHEVMWDSPGIERILKFVDIGALEAYLTGSGLILLETADWVRGRELSIYGMVGRDILKSSPAIIRDLKKIALHKGCSMIGGVGIPKGWKRAAPALGFKPVSTHFVMEI